MFRELHDISAEEQMEADLFTFRGDAFHKKITVRESTHLPESFDYAGNAGYASDGAELINYVAKDNVEIPPGIEVTTIVEFEEGVAFGEPYRASSPPHELYQDVHTHGIANVRVGGIPATSVKVE